MISHGPIASAPIAGRRQLAAGGAPQAEDYGTLVASPQRAESIREFAGYGVVFGAVAALLVATQPSPIGAVEYTVGTHQAAYASENRSFVLKGSPALFVVAQAPSRQIVSAPEQVDSGNAWVAGQVPETASQVFVVTKLARPQDLDDASAQVFDYVYPSVQLDSKQPGTLWAAPEQIESGEAWTVGPTPDTASTVVVTLKTAKPQDFDDSSAQTFDYVYPTVVPPDVKQPTTLQAAPEQVESGEAWVTGPQPQGIDVKGAFTRVAATEQIESGHAQLSRYVYPAVVGADVQQPRTFVVAPEQIDDSRAEVWSPFNVQPPAPIGGVNYTVGTHGDYYAANNGYYVKLGRYVQEVVAGTDVKGPFTLVSAPEQIDSSSAQIYGTAPESVAAVPFERKSFVISAPQAYEDIQPTVFGFTPTLTVVTRYFEADQEDPSQGYSGFAWTWGLFQAFVPGTDTRVGTFISSAEPFYEPVQYGLTIHPSADLIPSAVVAPMGDVGDKRRIRHEDLDDDEVIMLVIRKFLSTRGTNGSS